MRDRVDRPTGRLSYSVFENGNLVEFCDGLNLVVDASKQENARNLGGDNVNRSVNTIAFGTNGTDPAPGDTIITGQFTKAVDQVLYPTTNTVQFNFSLGASENNGMSIWEFGLKTGAGVLYARKTRATALAKTNAITVIGSWIITF